VKNEKGIERVHQYTHFDNAQKDQEREFRENSNKLIFNIYVIVSDMN
jgi:hypothetical protein